MVPHLIEEDQVGENMDAIEKELPLVLQTSEEARQQIINRNKKLFQQEAKQSQLEKIIFDIKNDSGNKEGSQDFDSADRQQYLSMQNQKTAQFRKNSASGDIRSNSLLSSERGQFATFGGQERQNKQYDLSRIQGLSIRADGKLTDNMDGPQ